MPRKIKLTEIAVGVVVNLDPKKLQADKSVTRTVETVDPQARLFACYSKRDGSSSWASLTSRPQQAKGYRRLLIKSAWKVAGSLEWRDTENYLYDGANTLHGPDSAVVAASVEKTALGDLGWIVEEGVLAIRDEITSQVGRREKAAGTAGAETTDDKGTPVFHGDPQ